MIGRAVPGKVETKKRRWRGVPTWETSASDRRCGAEGPLTATSLTEPDRQNQVSNMVSAAGGGTKKSQGEIHRGDGGGWKGWRRRGRGGQRWRDEEGEEGGER